MESVVVVGAGCFGAWTAHELARSGREVTLLDAYGPANSRASSGGETRVIRMGYGAEEIYSRWSLRSLQAWKDMGERSGLELFRETGVLWMARDSEAAVTATLECLTRLGVPLERLSRAELESRWPQIDFGPATWGILEPRSGVLMARRGVQAVVRQAVSAGVRHVAAAVLPPSGRGRLEAVATRGGETLRADAFVFACGPWLPKLFPDVLGERIFPTRQEVFYFGPPPGDVRFAPPEMPVWMDGAEESYGIPDIEARGFKVALDRHGPRFDPDSDDRVAGETLPAVREYLARRFPALAGAPLVASEVCQYENTSNGDFLVDRHPEMENVWLVGGGSGHGFKHGPALGEHVSRLLTGGAAVEERFSLPTKRTVQRRGVY